MEHNLKVFNILITFCRFIRVVELYIPTEHTKYKLKLFIVRLVFALLRVQLNPFISSD